MIHVFLHCVELLAAAPTRWCFVALGMCVETVCGIVSEIEIGRWQVEPSKMTQAL